MSQICVFFNTTWRESGCIQSIMPKRSRSNINQCQQEIIQYESADYWERRYKGEEKVNTDTWYYGFETLEPLILKSVRSIPNCSSMLEIGCGDSPLLAALVKHEEMAHISKDDKLYGIDFSKEVIKKLLSDKDMSNDKIVYEYMDATKLTYANELFDLILDKGTLDAVLCDKKSGIRNGLAVVSECVRVLKPTSKLMIVSNMGIDTERFELFMRDCLLPVLSKYNLRTWKVSVPFF